MSRIAEARARAGHSRRIAEEADRWELERQAATDMLTGTRSQPAHRAPIAPPDPAPAPAPAARGPVAVPDPTPAPTPELPSTPRWAEAAAQQRSRAIEAGLQVGPQRARTRPHAAKNAGNSSDGDRELADTMRMLFTSPRPVRSVLFCTAPGDVMSDVSWRAAELLAMQTRKTVAFVEDPANRVSPARSLVAGDLVTRIGWYPDSPAPSGPSDNGLPPSSTGPTDGGRRRDEDAIDDGLGGHVADLYGSFDFVIANATAPEADDLIPLASEVDSVIVLVSQETTPRAAAEALVTTLRNAAVDLRGFIYLRSANEPGQHGQEGLNIRG